MKTTLKTQTLLVTDERAFDLLGDNAALYGDNGGDSDGNSWLPSDAVTKDDAGVAEAIKDGYGEIVDACYYDQDDWSDISDNLHIRHASTPALYAAMDGKVTEGEKYEIEYEYLKKALEDAECINYWSGFNNGSTIIISWK